MEPDPDNPGKKRRCPRWGNGLRYEARWRDLAGNQKKQRFARKADADEHLAQVSTEKAAGTYLDPGAGKIIFQEFAEIWRQGRVHDPATAARIESEFRNHVYEDPERPRSGKTVHGLPALGHHQMGALSRSVSTNQAWIKGIPLAANSARLVILDVNQVYRAAVDDRRIGVNPLEARSIQKPTAVRRPPVAWTPEQVYALADNLPPRLSAIPVLGASTGPRKGELFAVSTDDLNFLRKNLHIEWQVKVHEGRQYFAPTKNSSIRDIPVGDPVLLVMAAFLSEFPAADVELPVLYHDGTVGKPVTRKLVFTQADGRAHDERSLQWNWDKARKAAGIPDVRYSNGMKTLRSSAASQWLSQGLSIAKVAALLGDTKEITLSAYADFMPDDEGLAREIMNRAFKRPAPESCAPFVPPAAAEA